MTYERGLVKIVRSIEERAVKVKRNVLKWRFIF